LEGVAKLAHRLLQLAALGQLHSLIVDLLRLGPDERIDRPWLDLIEALLCLGVIGLEGEGLAKALGGLGEPALAAKEIAEVEVRGGLIWRQANRAAEAIGRLVETSEFLERGAKVRLTLAALRVGRR